MRGLLLKLQTLKKGKVNFWHPVQEQFGIKLGNRLSKQHIEWEKNKMKVRYAAQTFSRSVADAIDHLREDVKHPDFKDSSTEFIRAIDTIFDMLNSRNPHGGLAKQPLRLRNQQNWAKAFDDAVSYLLTLKDVSSQPLYYGTRKTGIVGFIIAIESIRSITIDLLTRAESPYDYVLTYRWSQDSIELWFCKIRRRGGGGIITPMPCNSSMHYGESSRGIALEVGRDMATVCSWSQLRYLCSGPTEDNSETNEDGGWMEMLLIWAMMMIHMMI